MKLLTKIQSDVYICPFIPLNLITFHRCHNRDSQKYNKYVD